MIAAAKTDMRIIAVESALARVSRQHRDLLGDRLQTVAADELDSVLEVADILHMGRNPDEYDGTSEDEQERSQMLARDYETWVVDYERLQKMKPEAIVLHPRPRRNELDPSVDSDPRVLDVPQMSAMIPMRMAIIANLMGKSIRKAAY